jgi:hypothetical protein
MHLGIQIGLGIIAALGAIQMLRTADRISGSRYWVVGWLGYLLLLAFAARGLSPLLGYLPAVDDDVLVPCLLFGTMLLIGLFAAFKLWQFRRPLRRYK